MSSYSPRLLITGGNGQLATALLHISHQKNLQLIVRSHHEMDITSPRAIEKNIAEFKPDILINTAAYTAVDKAEQETELALQINYQGAKNLALACNKNCLQFIHLSTDYIFDGAQSISYVENDAANPINYYGKTKWLGEQAILEYADSALILRVSGIFSPHGQNFLKTILNLAMNRTELNVVHDQITCPTSAEDIANAILKMTSKKNLQGIYHYCSHDPVSWFEFCNYILQIAKLSLPLKINHVRPISSEAYKAPAKRPFYSVLACDKIQRDFALAQPAWQDAIKRYVPFLLRDLIKDAR